MLLKYHDLNSSLYNLEQKWKTSTTKDKNLTSVRIHLLRIGSPSGSLAVQLLDSNRKLIKESAAVTISSLGTGAKYHGFVRFIFNKALKKNTTFYLRLVSSGYSFSESARIGWCNDYGHRRKYNANYSVQRVDDYPLDLEFWTRGATGEGSRMRTEDFDDGFSSEAAPSAGVTKQSIGNSASATSVTGATVDSAIYRSITFGYDMKRKTDSSERRVVGSITWLWQASTSTWVKGGLFEGDADTDIGLTQTMTTSTGVGQWKVATDSHAGSNYSDELSWWVIQRTPA